jgi:hypothetical protein
MDTNKLKLLREQAERLRRIEYDIDPDSPNEGVTTMSIVEDPAIDSHFVCLEKEADPRVLGLVLLQLRYCGDACHRWALSKQIARGMYPNDRNMQRLASHGILHRFGGITN